MRPQFAKLNCVHPLIIVHRPFIQPRTSQPQRDARRRQQCARSCPTIHLFGLYSPIGGDEVRKRQRTAALQDLAEFVAASLRAKRLGVRRSSAAFGSETSPALLTAQRFIWPAGRKLRAPYIR